MLNEDILVVIQNDSAYSSWVPITLGTLHIDMVIEKATSEELQNGERVENRSFGHKSIS